MFPQTFDECFLHLQLAGYSLVRLSYILINPLGTMLSAIFRNIIQTSIENLTVIYTGDTLLFCMMYI